MRPLERYMLPCDTGNPAEQERLRAWHATFNAALQGALARGDHNYPDDYARDYANNTHGRVIRVRFHELGPCEYNATDTRLEPVKEDQHA